MRPWAARRRWHVCHSRVLSVIPAKAGIHPNGSQASPPALFYGRRFAVAGVSPAVSVIPAKAGIHLLLFFSVSPSVIPANAGIHLIG
ncbi:MAG: hypothetical protein ABIH86_05915 [Planctomycetota bacterium]